MPMQFRFKRETITTYLSIFPLPTRLIQIKRIWSVERQTKRDTKGGKVKRYFFAHLTKRQGGHRWSRKRKYRQKKRSSIYAEKPGASTMQRKRSASCWKGCAARRASRSCVDGK